MAAPRPVTDADAAALIALVGAAYDEHPGCVLDVDDYDRDLRAPASAIARAGGRWWVVDDGRRLAGSVAAVPSGAGSVELLRLYVAPSHRRQGLGARLVELVESYALEHGARQVELWSDTRFERGHRLYERLGYVATGEHRDLDDPSSTTELRYVRDL